MLAARAGGSGKTRARTTGGATPGPDRGRTQGDAIADGGARVLDLRGRTAVFRTRRGEIRAVDNASIRLREGALPGVVGEGGSGTSVTRMSLPGRLPSPPAENRGGQVMPGDTGLPHLPPGGQRDVRGRQSLWIRSAFPARPAGWTPIRTGFPAACGSG